jgi:hypothetical protein
LAGASDLGALLAAHRVLRFDGEGGVKIRPEPNLASVPDFPDAAQAG